MKNSGFIDPYLLWNTAASVGTAVPGGTYFARITYGMNSCTVSFAILR